MSLLLKHINEWAEKHPSALAVSCVQENLSYGDFVSLTASYKSKISNIPAGSRILLSGNNSGNFLALLLALIDSEMHVFLWDPRSSDDDTAALLADIKMNFLIFEKEIARDLPATVKLQDFEVQRLSEEIFPGDHKLYFFSSGSTGKPKAFGFTEAQLFAKMKSFGDFLGFHSADSSLVPLTITHSHGLMLTLPMLLSGGSVHYLAPKQSKAADVLAKVNDASISVLTGVPYQYNLMLEESVTPGDALRSLRYAFCGSAPMSEYLAANFLEKFGVRLNQAYGVSEIGPVCVNMFEEGGHNFRSVGKVLPYIDYKIINDEGFPSQEGELVVRSGFMSGSYINAPEDSAQTFRGGWIYTQDIVREDEHKNIYIIGRRKNFINVSGYKIYPVEVEKVLLSMKGVKDAAVFGVPDEARGQKIQAVVSTFIPLSIEEIREFCSQHLAAYKIPHQIDLVDELEHTSINKVAYTKYSGIKTR